LDIKADRNWRGVIRPTEKSGEFLSSQCPGRVREGDGVLVRLG